MNLSILIKEIDDTDLKYLNIEIETGQEYSLEYVDYILNKYGKHMQVDTCKFVYGSGKRKTTVQKHYEKAYKKHAVDKGNECLMTFRC